MVRYFVCLLAIFATSCSWLTNRPEGIVLGFDLRGNITERVYQAQSGQSMYMGSPYRAALPVVLTFASDFTEEYQRSVKNAATYWNRVLGRKAFEIAPYSTSTGTRVFITSEEASPPDPVTKSTEVAVTSFGFPKDGTMPFAEITFYNGWLYAMDYPDRESTSRHELAHVLGLDHFSDPTCILFPTIIPDDKPREACSQELKTLRDIYKDVP